jgi:quaternary ammonium compound-resistance protein SugE
VAWLVLVCAGLFEISGAVALGQSRGFRRPVPTVILCASFAASFYLLSNAVESIPIGTAYAVWTGIGAAGTAIVGMVALREPASALRIASLGLVVLGAVGLRLYS